jgi:gamma-glutamyltranspeptidase/glutathione hydrolase
MTPTIVLREGVPVLALGGSGGLRIAENVTQALLCRLAFGKPPQTCVDAPRFFAPPIGPALLYNADQAPSPGVWLDLAERGEQLKVMSGPDGTAVQMIVFERSAMGITLRPAADPRKEGVSLVE